MCLTLLFLLALLTLPHAGLAAEPDPLHLTGSRVRLSAADRSTAAGRLSLVAPKQVGTVIEVRPDTLLFKSDNQSNPALVPTASLMSLEVSLGMHSHVATGAVLGFLAGALVGGVISGRNVGYQAPPVDSQRGFKAAFGALVGGGIGAFLGAAIGSRQTEHWETLGLPIGIGSPPGTDAGGLSVEVTLR